MGKHETGYTRIERDHYPTPPSAVGTLAEHINLKGKIIWEMAAGTGTLAEGLKAAGARVFCSDIHDYGYPLHEQLDFLSRRDPKIDDFAGMVSNPPFGVRGRLAERFIEARLRRLKYCRFLALLLPVDFNSAITRGRLFGDFPHYRAKITLRGRIAWFKRNDGTREEPKENSAWYLWESSALRQPPPPLLLYAGNGNFHHE